MEKELKDHFGREILIERLERLLKIICTNEIMTEFHLQDEMYVIFEIKEMSEKYIK